MVTQLATASISSNIVVAVSSGRVTDSRKKAGVGSRSIADLKVRRPALSFKADVLDGASVSVIARSGVRLVGVFTETSGRNANTIFEALVGRWASDLARTDANSSSTLIDLSARVVVIANSSINVVGEVANTIGRVASSREMASSRSTANGPFETVALSGLASGVSRAHVVVIAKGTVISVGVRAKSSSGGANSLNVAFISRSRANNRIGSNADSFLAGIVLSASISVIASSSSERSRSAFSSGSVADLSSVALIRRSRASLLA